MSHAKSHAGVASRDEQGSTPAAALGTHSSAPGLTGDIIPGDGVLTTALPGGENGQEATT